MLELTHKHCNQLQTNSISTSNCSPQKLISSIVYEYTQTTAAGWWSNHKPCEPWFVLNNPVVRLPQTLSQVQHPFSKVPYTHWQVEVPEFQIIRVSTNQCSALHQPNLLARLEHHMWCMSGLDWFLIGIAHPCQPLATMALKATDPACNKISRWEFHTRSKDANRKALL